MSGKNAVEVVLRAHNQAAELKLLEDEAMKPLNTLVIVSLAVRLFAASSAAAQIDSPEATELANLTFSFDFIVTQAARVGMISVKAVIEGRLGRQLTGDESRRLSEVVERVFKDAIPRPDFEAHFANLYARYYSPQELKDLLAFYRTPLGTKVLRFGSSTRDENIQGVQRLMATHNREITERFNGEFAREFPELSREIEQKQKQK